MKGWECPKCHKVYSPWVDECKHCNSESEPKNDMVRLPKKPVIIDNVGSMQEALEKAVRVMKGDLRSKQYFMDRRDIGTELKSRVSDSVDIRNIECSIYPSVREYFALGDNNV